jgi:hypothetical protein
MAAEQGLCPENHNQLLTRRFSSWSRSPARCLFTNLGRGSDFDLFEQENTKHTQLAASVCTGTEQRRDDGRAGGEAHRLLQQPVRPPRRRGAAAQGSSLRVHPRGHEQQKRAAAQAQPGPQEGARAPPRRSLRLRVPRHRRVRRRGLRRAAPPAGGSLRHSHRSLLGALLGRKGN